MRNHIREINVTDRYVVVDAGCTWISIVDALEDQGLKLDFPAPFSGIYSTVGGAMSQNVPSTMKGILGIEVVRADGAMVRQARVQCECNAPTAQCGPRRVPRPKPESCRRVASASAGTRWKRRGRSRFETTLSRALLRRVCSGSGRQ